MKMKYLENRQNEISWKEILNNIFPQFLEETVDLRRDFIDHPTLLSSSSAGDPGRLWVSRKYCHFSQWPWISAKIYFIPLSTPQSPQWMNVGPSGGAWGGGKVSVYVLDSVLGFLHENLSLSLKGLWVMELAQVWEWLRIRDYPWCLSNLYYVSQVYIHKAWNFLLFQTK